MNNKYKLLVIKDETNIRSFVKTILDTNGYQVLTVGSSGQGILVYSSHHPDLVLLDLGQPNCWHGYGQLCVTDAMTDCREERT